MKKQNLRKLNLSKKSISKLEVKEIDKLKGGSGYAASACNSCWDCNEK
ncbi:MAG: TIGR04149 family rSAM-modified RiPP [Bacteroidota bacterium]